MHSASPYLARIDSDECVGCGVCVDMCPMDAITLEDDIAVLEDERCLGCGICAHHCDTEAVSLVHVGLRHVFVPPPRLNA